MRTYKIVMANKEEIKIDPEEVMKVVKAISAGAPAILKQGIFNPSRYSHIVEDLSRGKKEMKVNELGHYTGEYTYKYEELPDIFAEITDLAKLKTVASPQLN